MTNTLTISRELAEKLALPVVDGEKLLPERFQARAELASVIAAPVVESQEPVAWEVYWADNGDYYFTTRKKERAAKLLADPDFKVTALYTSPPAPIECGAPKNEFDTLFLRSIDSGNGQPGAFSHNSRPSEFNHENYGACAACGQIPKVYGVFQTDEIKPAGHDPSRAVPYVGDSSLPRPRNLHQDMEEMRGQRDLLAKAIGDSAVKAGIARADAELSGPMLLMLADDMADTIINLNSVSPADQ